MDLSLFPAAWRTWPERGMECDAAGQPCRHRHRGRARRDGVIQRPATTLPKALHLFGSHPFRELFHDHDFSDAGALSCLDVGQIGGDCDICRADLGVATLWIVAGKKIRIGSEIRSAPRSIIPALAHQSIVSVCFHKKGT